MIGGMIRKLGHVVYAHPEVPQDRPRSGPFGLLKIALVADYYTSVCLAAECRVRSLTPANYRDVLATWRPDLVFAESAFHGVRGEWRYMLARQPFPVVLKQPRAIAELAALARERGIPAVFWNKDDGAFFDAFIETARHFPHVFTTDDTCLPRYREQLPPDSTADVLAMPYQPAFHFFTGFAFEKNAACFAGSYYRRILHARRQCLDMMFSACGRAAMPLHVFDRNSNRLSHFFEFRFPKQSGLHLHRTVPYTETAGIYKHYTVSLNVNSVTASETMCSRRLLEILACGGICVTNPGPAVEKHFHEYCHVARDPEQLCDLLARLKAGPSDEDKARAAAGAAYVRERHTWRHRLRQLAGTVGFARR